MNDLYGAFQDRPDAASLGRRAAHLRMRLGKSVEDVAREAGVTPSELKRFEESGEASIHLLMGVMEALTPGGYLDHAFEVPRFSSIREVVAYEQRRTFRQ